VPLCMHHLHMAFPAIRPLVTERCSCRDGHPEGCVQRLKGLAALQMLRRVAHMCRWAAMYYARA
jgi:hypothetical protein